MTNDLNKCSEKQEINPSLARRLLEAYNQSGRTDLKLTEMTRKFLEAYAGVLNFETMQPKEAGDWFATFLAEQPATVRQEDVALITQEKNEPDALETQIHQFHQEGMSNRAIARELGVSEATIRRKLKT